jgi:hypothetical protein
MAFGRKLGGTLLTALLAAGLSAGCNSGQEIKETELSSSELAAAESLPVKSSDQSLELAEVLAPELLSSPEIGEIENFRSADCPAELAEPEESPFWGESRRAPQTNEKYLLEMAENNPRLSFLLDFDAEKLAESLSRSLWTKDHYTPFRYRCETYKDVVVMEIPEIRNLRRFDRLTLIRTYYLLQALADPEFRIKIGKELELDTEDTSCEHGGALHLLPDGKVRIEMLPDDSHNPNIGYVIGDGSKFGSMRGRADHRYIPQKPNYKLDLLAMFHFHASQRDYKDSAAASGMDFLRGGVVFTRMGERRFNADLALYLQLAPEDNREQGPSDFQRINLDLGVYGY